MLKYIILFIIFGVLGWIIDTAYISLSIKKFHSGTRYMFFSPTWGVGGVVLVLVYSFVNLNPVLQVVLAGLLLSLVELFGGLFSEKVFKKRYWDYSNNKWNYKGHIDVLHAFYWLILAAVFRLIFPFLPI